MKSNSQVKLAVFSSFAVLMGFYLFSYNYVQSKKILAYDYIDSNIFKTAEIKKANSNISDENLVEDKKEEVKDLNVTPVVSDEYIGYLSIPKINLNKGFLSRESSLNDVEKNIFVVEGSSYPDIKKGNLIIAAHSGIGWKAFFNDLYKLNVGDTTQVSYKNKKYLYQITNIYKQSKTGKVAIYRNYSKTTLTLVTCTNDDLTTQTIYIAELISVLDE